MPSSSIARPTLTRKQARDFYDRFGRRQDSQARYEKPALDCLVEHGAFGEAKAIVEFGCGTGNFAHRLLAEEMHAEATYFAFDLSETMADLARKRLEPFGSRATVTRTDGRPRIPLPASSCDRFVSNYVLDLLSGQDILRTLDQAWRVLRSDGLLCLTSLTYGTTVGSKLTIAAWLAIHSLRPSLVGGCRPIVLTDFLGPASWKVLYSNTVVSYGVPSHVLIARPRIHSQDEGPADGSAKAKTVEEPKGENRGHREP
jgi:ubiquinone/menaquinone biosynthesis C-methylase UbiE